ncbi:MAG: hypothetical protein ACRDHL_10810, partial [Candidatus Promineifilaceae bacterium]
MTPQRVKVKLRPGETLHFPAICVHCAEPAGERLTIHHRRGLLTRLIEVPVCAGCARQAARRSAEEERLGRLGG